MTNAASNVDLQEIINQVDYGINVVDQQFNILFMNMASRKKWNIMDPTPLSMKCHKLLFGHDTPCQNCPIQHIERSGEQFGQIVGALNTPDHPNHRVKYHKLSEGLYTQTLTDITRETELVRQVTIQSKETQAQNIILKRQRQQFEQRFGFLDSIFDSIRSGFLILDSSKNLKVTLTNDAFVNFLHDETSESIASKKCYQLFGFQRRCPGCPIERISDRTKFSALRYHQNVADYTLTEYYSKLPDGKILLIFEDSTKRVQLLHQVKEDKEIIERQNQIFRSLLETGTLIQQTPELDELFTYTLNSLHNLFFNMDFGIILNGERTNIIESAVFQGMAAEEQLAIVENNLDLLEPDISDLLAKSILERFADLPLGGIAPEPSHWSVLSITGRDSRTIGKLIIKGPDLEQHSAEIITLFLEQVAAVAENKLLTKKLEKMANTDPLTGAFNRGYFNRELEQSTQNAERFSIAFSVLMLDVNGLKRVNDVFGHGAGDEMIIIVAILLKEVCRKTDVVTRIGGDEFVVLCPSTNTVQAQRVLERIREKEDQTKMECTHPNGEVEVIQLHISIGVACSEDTPADEILKKADSLMYVDKEEFYKSKERYR